MYSSKSCGFMSQNRRRIVDFDQVGMRLPHCRRYTDAKNRASAVKLEIGKVRPAHDLKYDASADEKDDRGGESGHRRVIGTMLHGEPDHGTDAAQGRQIEEVSEGNGDALGSVLFCHAENSSDDFERQHTSMKKGAQCRSSARLPEYL
jgi:hypothetical protein